MVMGEDLVMKKNGEEILICQGEGNCIKNIQKSDLYTLRRLDSYTLEKIEPYLGLIEENGL